MIDQYELALINSLAITSPDQFNIGFLIKFLSDNSNFARYGFYKGFNDLLFSALMSDERMGSDTWTMSVLAKILSLGCSDPEFY